MSLMDEGGRGEEKKGFSPVHNNKKEMNKSFFVLELHRKLRSTLAYIMTDRESASDPFRPTFRPEEEEPDEDLQGL